MNNSEHHTDPTELEPKYFFEKSDGSFGFVQAIRMQLCASLRLFPNYYPPCGRPAIETVFKGWIFGGVAGDSARSLLIAATATALLSSANLPVKLARRARRAGTCALCFPFN